MTTSTSTAKLDAALVYAGHGDPMFPVWHAEGGRCGCRAHQCESPAKHPIASCTPTGLKEATTDEAILRGWWDLFPHANVALRTGITCVVVDVDPDKGGRDTLAALEAQHGPLPVTAKVLTGGGGWHLYFQPVPGMRNSAGKIGPGVDVRGVEGYVLVPGSNHVSGNDYRDDPDAPMYETPRAEMPAWLIALAQAPAASNGNGAGAIPPDEWAAKIAGAPIGQRRAVALEIAGHYLGRRIPPVEVESILLGYAARCSPPFPEREARELVRDLARKDRARGTQARPAAPSSADGPVLINLGDVAPEMVTWTWPQRVARGKLTVLIGEVGTGKTRVTIDMTSRSTRRLPWPDGGEAPEGDVLMLTSEDGLADTVRPIVDRQGGDPSRVHVLRAVRIAGLDTGFNLDRDLPALEQALIQTKAVLLIISPLSAYLGSKNSYQDSEIRGILTPLAALAEQYRVAVVGIMHLTKAAQRRILLRAQGSVAFVAQARTVLVCGKDEQVPGRFVFASVKNNLGPEAATLAYRIIENGLTWEDAPVEGTADQLLAVDEPATRTESRERGEAAAFLRDLLHDGPKASRQVETDAKANGISQRTLWRAKAELGVRAERSRTVEGNTGPWYWQLPVAP